MTDSSAPEAMPAPSRFRVNITGWLMVLRENAALWLVDRALALVPDSNLTRHVRRELELAGMLDAAADYGGYLGDSVMRLTKLFSLEGHSGGSAGRAIALFERANRFEPLTPLTGADDEWIEIGEGMFQNRRCGRVFKKADGQVYDIDGLVFRDPDGACYTNRESWVPVTFPYAPETKVVDRPAA